MLVDWIPADRLPWLLVWLDWNFYAYRPSLVLAVLLAQAHWVLWSLWTPGGLQGLATYNTSDVTLATVVGGCAWIVYCAVRYGYAVG